MPSTPLSFPERWKLSSLPPSRAPSPTIVDFPKVSVDPTTAAASAAAPRPRARSLLTEAILSRPPPPPTMPPAIEPSTEPGRAAREMGPLARYLRRFAPSASPPQESRDKRLRREAKERDEEERAEAEHKKRLEKKHRRVVRKLQPKLDKQYAEQRLRDLQEHEPHSEESDQEMDFTKSGEPKPGKTKNHEAQYGYDVEGARIRRKDSACFTPPQNEENRLALAERPNNQASAAKGWIPSIFWKRGERRQTK